MNVSWAEAYGYHKGVGSTTALDSDKTAKGQPSQFIVSSLKLTTSTHEQGLNTLASRLEGARGAGTPFGLFVATHGNPDGLLTVHCLKQWQLTRDIQISLKLPYLQVS